MGMPLAVEGDEMVPQVGEQAVPSCVSVQLTILAPGSLPTVAVNARERLTGKSALPGVSDTVIAGTVTVAVAAAALLNSEAAVMARFKSLDGAFGGAV